MRSTSTAVALVAKAPEVGKVKTRFCPPCSPEEATEFARAFLLDTSEFITGEDFAGVIDPWCTYLGGAQILRALLPEGIQLLEQRGADLDERLANSAQDLFAMGYQRVVLMAADSPTVNHEYLQKALRELDDHDVVLGPADDGGYTLIAMKADEPTLFVGIEMSTERVLRETIERAERKDLEVSLLETLYDLDTIDALLASHAAGQLIHARRTLALLAASSWAPRTQ